MRRIKKRRPSCEGVEGSLIKVKKRPSIKVRSKPS
jgi:hypothetical protein